MFTSDATIVDIVLKPRVSKRGKSKKSQTLAKEFALLKEWVGLLLDSASRMEEH